MLNRRDFLKRSFILAGGILVPTGIIHPVSANWWGSQGSGSDGISAWSNWNETSESDLQSDNRFVVVNAGGIGTSEIGQGGGLTGGNLQLTDVTFDIAGVSGGYRQLAAASEQRFTGTTVLLDTLLKNQSEFTIIVKVKDWGNVGTAHIPLIRVNLGACDVVADAGANSKMRFMWKTSDVDSANTIATTGVYWFCVWRKNGAVKAAFKKTTRPTKESDFAAGDTCESTDDSVFSAAGSSLNFFGDAARWCNIYSAYFVWAKEALFS